MAERRWLGTGGLSVRSSRAHPMSAELDITIQVGTAPEFPRWIGIRWQLILRDNVKIDRQLDGDNRAR
jgi:hypothetical protein